MCVTFSACNEECSILDILIQRMEAYTVDLELIVEEKTLLYIAERQKTERLLYQILPRYDLPKTIHLLILKI